MKALQNLPPAPSGERWVVVGPYCWGKGETAMEAYRNARRNLSSYSKGKTCEWYAVLAPANATVSPHGQIYAKFEREPEVIDFKARG